MTAFAGWSRSEDDYKSSASGGAASVLSQFVINQRGVVYGCAMLPDIDVRHVRIDKVEDLWRLKGSKYVQSDVSGVYRQLKEDVKAKRMTLFIGTPCQVAAVKAMYKMQPENLILVDLICHGVPSAKLLRQHVKKVADCGAYDNVIFRESNTFLMKIVSEGNVVYEQPMKKPFYQDWYINTFMDGYTYRKSCYHCHYASSERCSDITIGDYWGLGRKYDISNIPDHSYGCSVVLPITQKGMKVIEDIKTGINLYERPVDEAIEGNAQLQAPVELNWRRRLFRKLFSFMGYYSYDITILDRYARFRLGQLKRCVMK